MLRKVFTGSFFVFLCGALYAGERAAAAIAIPQARVVKASKDAAVVVVGSLGSTPQEDTERAIQAAFAVWGVLDGFDQVTDSREKSDSPSKLVSAAREEVDAVLSLALQEASGSQRKRTHSSPSVIEDK